MATDSNEPEALVRALGLSKRFGAKLVVDGVDVQVARGETIAILGPNGAGKSTTLRMIAGYLAPDEGEVLINGASMQDQRVSAQAQIGYLAEGAPLYLDLTAQAYLRFLARVHGVTGEAADAAIESVAADAGVTSVLNRPIETLSKGYRRRVALAGAMVHDPPVLILDEPTDGLDPNQKRLMRDWLSYLRPNKAILISTHQLDEVEAMCPRAVVIANGKVVADGASVDLLGDNPAGAFARMTEATALTSEDVSA